MNFVSLQSEVFRRLDESSTSPVFWSAVDVKAALNEGYWDFCERTRLVSHEAEVTCVRGVPFMDARAWSYPFLGLRTIRSKTLAEPLRPTSIKHVDELENRWEMSSGPVRRVMIRGQYMLHVWPVPQIGETFRVSWTSMPPEMVFDQDEPEIPEEHHEALVCYALYDLRAQEGETALALEAYGQYEALTKPAVKVAKDLNKTARTWIMGESRVY